MGMDSRVSNFHSLKWVGSTVLCFRGSFGMLSESALRLVLGDVFNNLPFLCQVISELFPLRNLYKPSSEQLLSQPCASLQDVSKQYWGKMFHTFLVPKPLSLCRANILCTPQAFFVNNASTLAPPYQNFPKSLSRETVIHYHRNKSKFIFAAEREKKIQFKGLTDTKVIFV